ARVSHTVISSAQTSANCHRSIVSLCLLSFFNDTATTEIYTLSLHDALPISHTHAHTHTHTQGHRHKHTHTDTHKHFNKHLLPIPLSRVAPILAVSVGGSF